MKTLGTLTTVAAAGLALMTAGAHAQNVGYLYEASGGLGGMNERLVIMGDGAARARLAAGRTIKADSGMVAPAALAELQNLLASYLDSVLTVVPGCDFAPPNSTRYTFGMWRNGKLQTLTTCDATAVAPLLKDSQMILQQVLASQHVVGRTVEIEVESVGPMAVPGLARGLTVYEDGRVATWERDVAGLRTFDFDLAGETALGWELRHQLRRELRRLRGREGRGETFDPGMSPAPASSGPVHVRLFSAGTKGSVIDIGDEGPRGGGSGGGVLEALLARL